ncbi:MAG TPA: hypothetical protein VGD40_04510 [Chryseosolibacter sp.]
MRKYIVGLILMSQLLAFETYAQEESSTSKKSEHYIGLQANQLIRQVFNFSNTNSVLNNPYLLTWSVNSLQTGAGFTMGLGYNFNQSNDGDQFVDRTVTLNDVFIRMGYEKKSRLAPKVIFSLGADVLFDRQRSETKTEEKTQSDLVSETSNTTLSGGFGPRFTLNYQLHEKILIGTEANFYFKWTKTDNTQKQVFFETVFDPVTGQPRTVRRTQDETESQKSKRFQLNSPAVIFLILKF